MRSRTDLCVKQASLCRESNRYHMVPDDPPEEKLIITFEKFLTGGC